MSRERDTRCPRDGAGDKVGGHDPALLHRDSPIFVRPDGSRVYPPGRGGPRLPPSEKSQLLNSLMRDAIEDIINTGLISECVSTTTLLRAVRYSRRCLWGHSVEELKAITPEMAVSLILESVVSAREWERRHQNHANGD